MVGGEEGMRGLVMEVVDAVSCCSGEINTFQRPSSWWRREEKLVLPVDIWPSERTTRQQKECGSDGGSNGEEKP